MRSHRISFFSLRVVSSACPKWKHFSVVRISNYIVKIHCRLCKGSCSKHPPRVQIKNRKHRSWAARMREKARRYFNSHYFDALFGASSSPFRFSCSYPVLSVSLFSSPAASPLHETKPYSWLSIKMSFISLNAPKNTINHCASFSYSSSVATDVVPTATGKKI